MKIKTAVFIVFLISTLNLSAQNWLLGAGSPTNDEALDIAVDNNSGDYYVTGYFTTNAAFGATTLNSYGNSDIFVAKYSVTGSVLWVVKAGGSGADRGYSIKVDDNGNVFVTGFYYGTATFGTTTITSVGNSQDVFIAKYTTSGSLAWVKSVGGADAETGYGITADHAGNVIVTGQFEGTATFGTTTLTSAVTPLTGLNSFDIFVVKYDGNGNFLWVEQGSAKYDDRGIDVATDLANNIFVAGQFSDTITFDAVHNNAVSNSAYLMKYDPNGNEQWFVKMSALQAIIYSLAVDLGGNVLITGDYKGNLGIFTTPMVFNTSAYSNKIFIAKFSNSGSVIWVQNDGSDNEISSKSIALDASGDAYIVGLFKCRFDEYSQTLGTGLFYSSGYRDVFITKYTSTGTRQWFKQFGSNKDDYSSGIAIKAADKPLIAGSFENRFNVPSTPSFTFNASNFNYYGFPYCSNSNYQKFIEVQTNGQKDIFVTSPVDAAQAPFDYFIRSGSLCVQDFLPPCINNCQDSIQLCGGTDLHANVFEIDTLHIGPQHNFVWSNGSTWQSSNMLTIAGTYWLQSSREDLCFENIDTIYAALLPIPSPPLISDNHFFNINKPPTTNEIRLCSPDTAIIWAHSDPADSVWWSSGYGFTVINDTTISTFVSGLYTANVLNSVGCGSYNNVTVEIDTFANHDVLDPRIVLSDTASNRTDSISICEGSFFNLYVMDSGLYVSNQSFLPYCTVHWSISPSGHFQQDSTHNNHYNTVMNINSSGYYTISCVLKDYCADSVTYNFSRTIYVYVRPNPTPIIVTPSFYCPADTIWLYTTCVATTLTWSGPGILSNLTDSIMVLAPTIADNMYYINASILDAGSGLTCSGNTHVTLIHRPYPDLTISPADGIACPFDSVLITCDPGLNYYWVGPAGDSIGNTQSIYVQVAGYYHCILTEFDGCIMTSNFIEVKEYNTPYLVVQPGNHICASGSAIISVQASNSALIQWQPPLSGSAASQTVSSPGTYICHITQCNITTIDSVVIILSATPSFITSTDSTLCPGDTLILYGNGGMVAYNWISQSSIDPYLYVTQPGTYILQTTDAFGCFGYSAPFTVTALAQPPPPLVSDTTICAGQSITIIATSPGAVGWYYSVSASMPFHTGDTLTTPVIISDTTFYVQTLDSVCGSTMVPVNVLITTSSGMPNFTGDTTLCTGDSLILIAGATGVNYSWTGPGGFTSSLPILAIGNITSANAGLYTLQYNTIFCTSLVDIFNVVVNPLPTPVISPDSTIFICPGTSVMLQVDSVFSSYHWFPVNLFTQVVSVNTAGSYYAEVTENGCTGTSDTTIVSLYPLVPDPIVTNDTVCTGNAATLTATGGGILTWYDSLSVQVGTGNSFTTPVLSASVVYYVQSVDTTNGCAGNMVSVSAIIPGAFTAPVVTSNSPLCEGDDILFSTPAATGAVYTWTGPNGFSSSVQNPTITNAHSTDSGIYQLIISIGGCFSVSGNDTVIVNPIPAIPAIAGNIIYCENDTLYLTVVNPNSTLTYHWSSLSGSITSDSNYISHINLTIADGGNYTFSVSQNGCVHDTTTFITVNPEPAAAITSNNTLCVGDTLHLNAGFVAGGSYQWNGVNGYSSTLQDNIIVPVSITDNGTYNLVITLNGCVSNTASVSVVASELPVINLGNDTAFCEGESVTFTLPSLYTYLWMDGSTSNVFTVSDSSLVYVYAYSGAGCQTIDSVMVDDYHCLSFHPNFMTPNGDGENDFFRFDVEGAKSLECIIYDRWGREVYRWNDVNGFWDGKRFSGKDVDEGVYYYVVSITFVDYSAKTYNGFLELIK